MHIRFDGLVSDFYTYCRSFWHCYGRDIESSSVFHITYKITCTYYQQYFRYYLIYWTIAWTSTASSSRGPLWLRWINIRPGFVICTCMWATWTGIRYFNYLSSYLIRNTSSRKMLYDVHKNLLWSKDKRDAKRGWKDLVKKSLSDCRIKY